MLREKTLEATLNHISDTYYTYRKNLFMYIYIYAYIYIYNCIHLIINLNIPIC